MNVSAVVLFQKSSNASRYYCHYFIKIVFSGRLFRISFMVLIDVTMVSLLLAAAPSTLKAHEPFSDAV